MSAGKMKRHFVKARLFWVEEALPALAIGTAREPAWFSGFADGPIDAPEYMPAGAVCCRNGEMVAAMIVERGGQ